MRSVITRKTEDVAMYLATTAQRQQALAILARYMNDTSKKVAERKMDAKVILDTVDTVPDSEAHKAAATAVMTLADE